MNRQDTLVSAIDAYYRDRNLHDFHVDMLNDPRADLSDQMREHHKVNSEKHQKQSEQLLGYIKMLFLKDLDAAPSTVKDLWYGTDN